ncbi:proline-rich protein 35 [Hyperolius riggenbachi]|uniref:proline-rich protein 35 n=1 Tax=Hyperolius riggenbachi TaxID=752182 RepID=UPI0035A35193
MSKEEEIACKLNSSCKHKERKPKKPHYIPRPWGKPYNYKCFQCPFTCMEKSHLYNHMKYSLCKNSLSLLIESDWPYKKNNFLVPEVNLHHEAHIDKQDACDSSDFSAKLRQTGEKSSSDAPKFIEEDDDDERLEDEEEEESLSEARKEKSKSLPTLQVNMSKNEANVNDVTEQKSKKVTSSKEGEPEFIITNVFSLGGHCEKDREEQRFAKVSRKSSNSLGSSRLDQWKLLTNTLKKTSVDTPVGCIGANTIPCYPPPTYADYQEHQGLSFLGLNYPKNSNLFSYLNPTMTSSAAQLPFLTSTAQLMHPAHFSHFQALQNTERSSFLPQFYYPLLFEHTLGTSDSKTAGKPVNQSQPANTPLVATPKAKTPVEPLKTSLIKTPETNSLLSWGPGEKLQKPTVAQKSTQESESKWVPQTVRELIQQHKEILGVYGVQGSRINENATLKGATDGYLWGKASPTRCFKRKTWLDGESPDVITDQTTTSLEGERTLHSSSCSPITSPDHWCEKSPILEAIASKRRRDSNPTPENTEPAVADASLLIGDLSRTLEEYGRVERKLACLTSDDGGRQKTLSEQLGKIRLELLHIHHALEKASSPHEGPLDLSLKRTEDVSKEDPQKVPLSVDHRTPPSPECSPKQVVKVELLPPELATCYVRPTKCEADSSVLLCPDGRVGSAGVMPPQLPVQEEGVGVGVGFSRGRLQMENV